ncbi:MAG: hypothetical protein SGI91_22585 [Alphaproteobacteria bacterium]|nr:hypothetical protein [Alphaproteobacteria bacterium]
MLTVAVLTARPSPAHESVLAYSADALDVSTGVPLNAIQDPAAVLPSMLVETSAGEKIGEVRSVEIDSSGAVRAVTVVTRGLFGLSTVSATISGDDVVYLRERNSLVSRLTQTEIATKAGVRKKARL